jgi:two-component system chemotaxis response regulator CheY
MDILAVDDSKTILSIISFVLEKEGYSVKCCFSAEDALDFLKAEDVKLIITDINMPGIGGKEFIKSIRSKPEYKATPIIVNSTIVESKANFPEATEWLVKPLNPHKLIALLKTFDFDLL